MLSNSASRIVLTIVIYSAVLLYFINSLKANAQVVKQADPSKVSPKLKEFGKFGLHFFTIWNFALQIYFLTLAVLDEIFKLLSPDSKLQKKIQKSRHFIFSTLVFPSTCLVMTIFWSLWHVDRELIFPKAIDSFYPNWLNHTLHSFIAVPLILEIFLKEPHYHTTRKAVWFLVVYATIYKILFLSVYFRFGLWLYPIYGILDWTQRILFIGLQLALMLAYQKIGMFLLRRDNLKVSANKVL